MRSISKILRARVRPLAPTISTRDGLSKTSLMRDAKAAASPAGNNKPASPTTSARPPMADAITNRPSTICSIAENPAASSQTEGTTTAPTPLSAFVMASPGATYPVTWTWSAKCHLSIIASTSFLCGPSPISRTSKSSSSEFKMDPLVSLYYFAPVCAIMNGVTALFLEVPNMTLDHVYSVGLFTLLANAMVAFGLNVSVVFLVSVQTVDATSLCRIPY